MLSIEFQNNSVNEYNLSSIFGAAVAYDFINIKI